MQKTCGGPCKETKSIEDFDFKDKAKGKRRSYCKTCARNYSKKHYDNNPAYYVEKARVRNEAIRNENYDKLYAYLSEHPCVDCGETDLEVLEFDHICDKEDKRREVTLLVREAYSWGVIETEIAKCEVRCANCHRRKTSKQFNWRKRVVPVRQE